MDLKELTDAELMKEYQEAIESQIGRKIEQCKKEMSRRNKEQ